MISTSYIIFKVNEEAFLQDYIVYFLKSEYGRRQIEDYNNGTVRNSLSFEDFGIIQIPHMTIDEQRRLVDLISNTTFAKVKLLDSYNSILKVGIPESSFAQFNTEFEEIELGKLIVEDEKPTYGCSKKSDDNENGYSILKMNNIYPVINEDTLGDEIDRVSLTDVEIEKYVLHKDDILVNRTNSLELVGKTGLFDANTDDAQKYVFASYIMRFHLLEGYSPKYIAYYMNLSTVKMKIKEYAIQSNGQYNINFENLKKLKILYPKDATIVTKYENEFDQYCEQLENLIALADKLETEEMQIFGRYLKK